MISFLTFYEQNEEDIYQIEDFDDDEFSILIDEEEDLKFFEENREILERVTKSKVIRGGKRKIKYKTDRAGYKLVKTDSGRPKEVRMDPTEIRKRKKAAKKAARKRRPKNAIAVRKRAKSIKKRTW